VSGKPARGFFISGPEASFVRFERGYSFIGDGIMEVAEFVGLGNVEEVELKYCERCGGLWLREKGCQDVYCSPCVPKMAEFAVAKVRKRRARLPVGRGIDLHGVEESELCLEGAFA